MGQGAKRHEICMMRRAVTLFLSIASVALAVHVIAVYAEVEPCSDAIISLCLCLRLRLCLCLWLRGYTKPGYMFECPWPVKHHTIYTVRVTLF